MSEQIVSTGGGSVSIIVAGSGGAGVMTTGSLLLAAAGRAGWYGYMTRSAGAQIRGGEAAALLRLSEFPIVCHEDTFDLLVALDWRNLGNFSDEMPLGSRSLVVGDSVHGEAPPEILAGCERHVSIDFRGASQGVPGARPNMIALGMIAKMIGLPDETLDGLIETVFQSKGERVVAASYGAVAAGRNAAEQLPPIPRLQPKEPTAGERWSISGSQAAALGAIRGGVRFVAAYPITPATEMLEWLGSTLKQIGGVTVQVEDELAAISQIIGASYGGTPALTATAGPGFSLMTESLGLAVASEIPIVVVDVMRGGPSTGIPAKSEQADLNIALYGVHGDAPHLVLAANSIEDCLFTVQWAVHLTETLQTAAVVLSDQALAQAHVVTDRPPEVVFPTRRVLAHVPDPDGYRRYALTESGVSPMALPGTPGCQYTADGLEHTTTGVPSSRASDHVAQLDKRLHKLTRYDYGAAWADVEGEGDTAILTWGSSTGAAREAVRRLRGLGVAVRLVSVRLLSPIQPEQFAAALAGVTRVLVLEQSHGAQFLHYLRANYYESLPHRVESLHRPGPLPFGPGEIVQRVQDVARECAA